LAQKEFEGRLDELITDAVRNASSHVMFAVDVEGLQEIVKVAGKKTGAQLLKKLARLIEKQNTGRGVVGRLGTNRFGVLVKNTSIEDGREILERQRKVIAKVRCMWKGETFPLTTSAGISRLWQLHWREPPRRVATESS
jgi:diguanylate cyclase (GGDEF)-like protein